MQKVTRLFRELKVGENMTSSIENSKF